MVKHQRKLCARKSINNKLVGNIPTILIKIPPRRTGRSVSVDVLLSVVGKLSAIYPLIANNRERSLAGDAIFAIVQMIVGGLPFTLV